MIVEVIEFRLPNGRQIPHELEIDDKCKEKYEEIINMKCRLTSEVLQTGEVSQAIEHSEFDFDIALTSGKDFDENKKALENLILRFNKDEFQRQLSAFDN